MSSTRLPDFEESLLRPAPWVLTTLAIVLSLAAVSPGYGQTATPLNRTDALTIRPRDRVAAIPENAVRMELKGFVHPLARADRDRGAVPPETRMEGITLTLRRSQEQQAALDQYSTAVHDPQSPLYHHWLTPEEYGGHFGLSSHDLDAITRWLQGYGFTIDEIPSGHWTIRFSGSAAQVQAAFDTAIHYYSHPAGVRYANAAAPRIPDEWGEIVLGIDGLNNFPAAPDLRMEPRDLSSLGYYMTPADFYAIYNLSPMFTSGFKGAGVSVAAVAQCAITDLSQVQAFRTKESLPAMDLQWLTVGSADPCDSEHVGEANLDLEWASATAPEAQIMIVGSNSLFTAVQDVIQNSRAQIVSVSYGNCETLASKQWMSLWQQADAQGITGFVSSGDTGAAACDQRSAATATHGLSINGICASQYVTCVGGTQFDDGDYPNSYWSGTSRALGYIPEIAWNETKISTGLFGSTGGGFSDVESRPSWQDGNPDSRRGVPDVALSAAFHDGYFVCDQSYPCGGGSGSLAIFSGTSASTPAFAGIMAVVVQTAGQQGSANTALYGLAGQSNGSIFHDVVAGNNSVAGLDGYSAGPGWDPVTGLGSVDASALISNWPGSSASAQPTFQTIEMSRTTASDCDVPPAASSFNASDGTAYFFFVWSVKAVATNRTTVSSDFLAPDGAVISPGSASHFELPGPYCSGNALDLSKLPATELGEWQARVYFNGAQVGSTSFTVSSTATAKPTITSLSPSSVTAGGGPFVLTINGTNFVSNSGVSWNGSQLPATYVSPTQLNVLIGASLIASAGSVPINVTSPGGGSDPATFTITPSAAPFSITEYALPAGSVPYNIASGADGNLWFTDNRNARIGKMTVSGAVTTYTGSAAPFWISPGPDGNVWYTSLVYNTIGSVTSAGTVTLYGFPSDFGGAGQIVQGLDGNVWFTGYSDIGKISPSGTVTEYPLPTHGSFPLGITAGPDGNYWFTEPDINRVGKITPGGVVTEYQVPTPDSLLYGITAGPDGNLWFAEQAGKIGSITPAGTMTEYSVPGSSPAEITAGPDGNLWFTNYGTNSIGKITRYGTVTQYPIATADSEPLGITTGPDGNIWFTESNTGKIGKVTISTAAGGLTRAGSLSQLAAGGGWDTAIYLTNASAKSVTAALLFHGDDGNPLTLPVTVTQQGTAQTLNTSTVTGTIAANTTLIVNTGSLPNVAQGWVEVLGSAPIDGFAVFRYAPQGLNSGPGVSTPWEGTVPLQTDLTPTSLTVPFDNTGNMNIGLAIGNLTSSSASYSAKFFDYAGGQLGSAQTFSLPGNGHTAFVLGSTYPITASGRGVMQVTGPSMTALGLRASPYGTLTSISLPLGTGGLTGPLNDGSGQYEGVLPHIAVGGGWDTSIYLTNSTPNPVHLSLVFRGDDGGFFSIPFTATQPGSSQGVLGTQYTAAIPSNTTFTLSTGALAATITGTADVFTDGPVSGFAVFRYAPQGLNGSVTPWEGTVPMQTDLTPTSLTLPFDNIGGFGNGVALRNLTASAANYTIAFYDENGAPLGSPQTVSLGGRAHASFVLGSQYSFTANRRGLMKVTGPALAAIGLRGSPYGTLTAIPVPFGSAAKAHAQAGRP